ncbi:unnamed protein product [Heterobilharzia americana]|nr:unnamed protein product [Heterobilharzia americana]
MGFVSFDLCLCWSGSVCTCDGFPKRIIAEAIVRCCVKVNNKQNFFCFLKQHCLLSTSYEDYIGHLVLRFSYPSYGTKQERIELLKRLLLAVPPCFVDCDSSVVIRKSLSTQSQIWADLSSLWNDAEIKELVSKTFHPAWFSKIALLYAELVNIPLQKGVDTSLTWVDNSLTRTQIGACQKLALRILTSYSKQSNNSTFSGMLNGSNINSDENGEQSNSVCDTHELPFIPKEKCCSTDAGNSVCGEIQYVFFQVFIAPFGNIYIN